MFRELSRIRIKRRAFLHPRKARLFLIHPPSFLFSFFFFPFSAPTFRFRHTASECRNQDFRKFFRFLSMKTNVPLDKKTFVCYNNRRCGVLHSLVVRLVRDQEAAGSSPVTPTSKKGIPWDAFFATKHAFNRVHASSLLEIGLWSIKTFVDKTRLFPLLTGTNSTAARPLSLFLF